jgi:hypothetical protein
MQAARLLRLPLVKLRAAVNRLDVGERERVSRRLEGLALRAAFVGEYVGEASRIAGDIGDNSHHAAVKSANRTARIIHTKAMGYNAYLDIRI